jgi:alkylation response protein AidB-like acyl-CoA dehydrogenase
VPFAQLITFTPAAESGLDVIAHHSVDADTWRAYCEAHVALLLGLLDGACERLTHEAYAYAKERRSAGKPISQLQAVALRLADIALNRAALALYLSAAVEQTDASGSPAGLSGLSVPHVADLAFRISRDAVQIAAAHGYVEGLPFKRLFEQVGTLVGVLTTCQSGLALVSRGPFH